MTLPTKITVIGAGSASFGENTLSAIMRSQKLKGSTLALVDRNARGVSVKPASGFMIGAAEVRFDNVAITSDSHRSEDPEFCGASSSIR